MKAIDDRYKAAMIDEYESYVRAKRTKDAEHVAQALLDRFGYDVHAEPESEESGPAAETKDVAPAPQTTAAAKPPEAAVEPQPKPATAAAKPAAAKKTATAKTAAAKPQAESK